MGSIEQQGPLARRPVILVPFLHCHGVLLDFVLINRADSGLIPTPYTKWSLEISHLIFTDDVMNFTKATTLIARNLKRFLDHFGKFSWLKVNGVRALFSSLIVIRT